MNLTVKHPPGPTTDHMPRVRLLDGLAGKLTYCGLITAVALGLTYCIVIVLYGASYLREWIWAATLIPILVAPPIAFVGQHRRLIIHRLSAQLKDALDHDHLTRANTRQRLVETFHMTRGEKVIVMIDADHFKRINDDYGHQTGDEALRFLVDSIRAHLRRDDIVSRFGGEEFVLLLVDADADEGLQICERLRRQLNETPLITSRGPVRVLASMGLAVCAADEDLEAALARADNAVYRAKSEGRNRIVIADPPHSEAITYQAIH